MTALVSTQSAVLDGLDRKLVRALQLDPRAAFSRIGDVLDVSEQTVARRYRRLRRDGLLRVTGVVDPRALGLTDWMLRLRCRPDGALAVAEALARREDVSWVSLNSGGAEVMFALRSRTAAEREDLLLRRLPNSAPVLDISAAMILHRYIGSDPADWRGLSAELTPAQARQLCSPAPRTSSRPAVLEPGDDQLLDLLARDGRTSYAMLARATRMSMGRVMRRVSALDEAGVIYFDLDIAVAAMGDATSATLWLTVSPAHLDAAGRAFAEHDEVPFAAAITGRSNLVTTVTCADDDGLHRYVTTKLATIEGVTSYELAPVLRRIKQAGALIDGDRLANPPPTQTGLR
jgi:DNA-binding Lrp family transcriptional regulator